MPRFVALLRAVNVGGSGKVSMEDVSAALGKSGLREVRTLLQSGNVVFTGGSRDPDLLEGQIQKALRERLKIEAEVMVRSEPDWFELISRNPFPNEANSEPSRLTVAVLKSAPTGEQWKSLKESVRGRETIREGLRLGYIYFPDGQGRSKLTPAIIERKLQTRTTIRNWNTVMKIGSALRS